jgi:hypothetical protein
MKMLTTEKILKKKTIGSARDDNGVQITAGFVVPEFASVTTLTMLFIIAALLVAVRKKK